MLTHKDITKPLVRRLLTLAFLSLRDRYNRHMRVIADMGLSKLQAERRVFDLQTEHHEMTHAQVLMAIHMQHCPDIPMEAAQA